MANVRGPQKVRMRVLAYINFCKPYMLTTCVHTCLGLAATADPIAVNMRCNLQDQEPKRGRVSTASNKTIFP
ncbi:hypothetical protein POVWA2_004060 [Plasmodium ovale wallikeri]|uniref:Uncharacterized protein n=1 Tax=Plasmodium ovale wallikeri TaxID=864142 RepID=A0A1A8YIP9_PLAOA|nr:hypothetical protein POVWA1_003920 [Plasmodium ovale wallikeri]SBT31422.1 hypothetical protein POVWA2_004060 [Plasmodium ovale wallikeri]